jgi:hypothetical protein
MILLNLGMIKFNNTDANRERMSTSFDMNEILQYFEYLNEI